MENKNRTIFVVNPASGNGRTDRKWNLAEKELRKKGLRFDVRFTEAALHATQITVEALRDGYEHIIAVGGDGTINEVLNGFYVGAAGNRHKAAFSLVPMGTGSDFARNLRLANNINYVERLLTGGEEQSCDVVRADYRGWNGENAIRYFINVADVGIGSETVYRVNRNSKAWGGFLSFLAATIASILSFKNPTMTVEVDGQQIYSGKSTLAVVNNGKWFGGGVMISPQAEINDGYLDILVAEGLSARECLGLLPKAYRGKHLSHPRLHVARGKEVWIKSTQKLFLEIDGESPGIGDIHFQILPGDLKLVI